MTDLILPFFAIIPVIIAVFLFIFSTSRSARIVAILFQLCFTLLTVGLLLYVRDGPLIVHVGQYVGVLGIILRADSFVAVFILLVSIIFLAVSFYSLHEINSRLYWFLLFILEGTLIGVFLTQDLFNVFVLVEVSTIIVTVLLMFYRQRRVMYRGMVFLMLNVIAMLFYLFGLAFFYQLAGTFDMYNAMDMMPYIDRRQLMLPYALIMTGLAFKCAIIPMFSFTPKTVLYSVAPSAVAAVLSGVQIKTNVYLFLRFQELFQQVSAYDLFLVMAIVAGLTGVVMAISQTNIKMILAYHTISQVGLIMIGLSSGSHYSFTGGLYHIVSHGIFKSALFLTAGVILHSYGTLNVYQIRGVLKRHPMVGAITAAAILGITGAPFFIGSISKYFITSDVPWWVNWSVILISLGTLISFIKYGSMLFGTSEMTGDWRIPDKWRLFSTLPLGVLCLVGGIFGQQIINFLFEADVVINRADYLQKAVIFFVSAAVGWLIYKYVVKGNIHLKRLGSIEFSFNTVCASLVGFFVIVLGFVGWVG